MLELYVARVHHFEELYLWANNAYVAHFYCVHFGRYSLSSSSCIIWVPPCCFRFHDFCVWIGCFCVLGLLLLFLLKSLSVYFFLIHSSVDGHFSCFHSLAIMNNAAVNITCKFLCAHMFSFPWTYSWKWNCGNNSMFNLPELPCSSMPALF